MNALPLLNQTVSSLEVAEMMEQEHKELLKRIRRFTNQLDEGKIPLRSTTFLCESKRQKP